MDFYEAGIEVGYSKSYMQSKAYQAIRKDTRYASMVAECKAVLANRTVVTREKVLENIQWGIDQARKNSNLTALKGFLELQGKAIAMYSDKHITEDSDTQKELDAHKASEAKELATIRLTRVG